jgi:hypothetical protein
METKTVLVTDKTLIERLTALWDGKADYVLDGGQQYRVIVPDDGLVNFYTDVDTAKTAAQDVKDEKNAARREAKADAKEAKEAKG